MTAKLGIRDISPACAMAVTAVAFILAWAFPRWPGDGTLLLAAQGWRNPALDILFRWVTYLGWTPVAVALSLAAVAALLAARRWADALFAALSLIPAALIPALKQLVGRPRPELAWVESLPHSLAFPSGHTIFAMLFGGLLIYLAWRGMGNGWLRWGLTAALTLLILLVGISRVYLGVHWPSDVMGGYLYGGTVLLAAARLRGLAEERRRLLSEPPSK